MAKELAHFKNFAKLKDTKVAFNDITVIAGKPGTGKSYVMKFMYAIDEALSLLNNDLDELSKQTNTIALKLKTLDKLHKELESGDEAYKSEQYASFKTLLEEINKLNDENSNFFNDFMDESKDEILILKQKFQQKIQNLLNSIFVNIEQISHNFKLTTEFLTVNYDKELELLIHHEDDIDENDTIETNFKGEILFVETPLILEFKKFMNREKGKTPYHIESLLNILDADYSFTDTEQDKFIKEFTQKSKEIIKGDIESSGDSFIFNKEGDKNYDIVNASSGTKSIGLLQYLVTNKALKKGSVLYWEEPEVHLHPEWQLKMVELFVELMNAGVKIIFSTHSTFMVDSLNALSKRDNYSDRISFNLFKELDGIVENTILDSDENWGEIQNELLKASLEEIMWQYL